MRFVNCCLLCLIIVVVNEKIYAQKKTILIEPQKRKINQDALLPAQTYFTIQVPVSSRTGIMLLNVYKGKTVSDKIESNSWTRPVQFSGEFAEIPVDLKLKSNSNYTFQLTIYNLLSDSERTNLRDILSASVVSYLDAAIENEDSKIIVSRKSDQLIKDLNDIVNKGLSDYQNIQRKNFEGFSDIVKLKIQQLTNAQLKNAGYNLNKRTLDSSTNDQELRAAYSAKLRIELKQLILAELHNYLGMEFVKLYDSFVISNQFTEKTQTVLPLFIGYGAVYFSGNARNLNYDSKPYAGFSIPLGRGDGKYFSRTTFIMGVFLTNFKDSDNNTITGPIVDRPVFAGLGFRIYDFINFNAGAVATSTSKQNLSNIKTENIKVYPFIGLNFQFNLWLGVNKK